MKLLLVLLYAYAINAREFRFLNKLSEAVWVGAQGNPNYPNLNGGGWILGVGESVIVQAQDDWSGRFWGRSYCDPQTQHCETGDCGNKLQCNGAGGTPPASLAEFTLKGEYGLDWYDVSLVDGFNLQMSIQPIGGQSDGRQYSCEKCSCLNNILSGCPEELQVKKGDDTVIACNSACNKFGGDEYCCRPPNHNSTETCRSTDWPVNYPKYFKDRCPDAYSYAFDDHKSTFTCIAPVYLITFGG